MIAESRRSHAGIVLGQRFRLLFIGRLDSYKRVDWLIHAFSLSKASQLDIVGDGPQRQVFQELAASSVKSNSIVFHGRLDEATKQSLLRKAHLLVLPADRCNEAFGIVQIEAMACGVPALALDCPRSGAAWVGSIKYVIGFTQMSRTELAKAINCLVSKPSLWNSASEVAEQRYRTCFARTIWQSRFNAQLL